MQILKGLCFIAVITFCDGRRKSGRRDTNVLSYKADTDRAKYKAYQRARINTQNDVAPTDSCYETDGSPKKCEVSEFENVAIGKDVTASSTCGSSPQRFCRKYLDIHGRLMNDCSLCDASQRSKRYNPELAIDTQNATCWLSDFFGDSTQEENVTYTISLKKTYELTYIILDFCNKIPESLTLFKSSDNGRTWRPLQYYSSDCQGMYGVQENEVITHENEQKAICKDVYNPNAVGNGRVAFSFHVGRPSATILNRSPILLDWITVTDIKLEFKRLDKPGNGGRRKSGNYYSLSELVLGGRCKCNGHANGCTINKDGETVCQCKHNTAGRDCERCKPFYIDRPWNPAKEENANECVACECNGHSNRCIFSRNLYLSSGRVSGGVCQNCQHNTDGPQCQYCATGFFRNRLVPIDHNDACAACGCHPSGSVGETCTDSGQCLCKEGVAGSKCTECKPGYVMTRSFTNPCEKIRKTERESLYEVIALHDGSSRTVQRSSPTETADITSGNSKSLETRQTERESRPIYEIIAPSDMSYSVQRSNPTAVSRITSGDSNPISPVGRDQNRGRRSCNNCQATTSILTQEKYCKSYFVIIARVLKREKVDSNWMRFQVEVTKTYKVGPLYSRVRRSMDYVYVKKSDLKCQCPKLRTKKTYIMIGVTEPDPEVSRDGFVLDKDSVVVRQRQEYESRIEEFSQAARDVSCFRIAV